jgi:hypothetical protein
MLPLRHDLFLFLLLLLLQQGIVLDKGKGVFTVKVGGAHKRDVHS